ncbi:hypothetical protein B296_00050233 [Ensete ventricosum]|uniref:Uncharacterized protein n=1 Tax=Ensete ventricosum TaxID=4639 RepID=A0A426X3M0_ENSVE|nr:hypothetical protein B296_00050233 [Ensete ventricosum]
MESLVALNRKTPLEAEPPQCQVAEAHAASPTPAPARSQNRSCDPVQTGPDFDTLSSDTVDSLREQVCQVHQRLDEVQKEVLKSRGEIGESSKGGSPFTPEIQGKPLPATFRLLNLEPYNGSDDLTEHIAAFRAQMTLYDMSDTPEDTTRRHRRGGRTVRACCRQDPPSIPLNSTRTEIFFQIREKGLLKAPNPMKSHSERCIVAFTGNTTMTRRNVVTCNIKSKTSSGTDTYIGKSTTNPHSPTIDPLEIRYPDPKVRSRSKSTSSSEGQP